MKLTEVGPSNSIPQQVRRIIEDYQKVHGEDQFRQLFNEDWTESLIARIPSYEKALLSRGIEADLVRRGVGIETPGSIADIRLPKTAEEAASNAASKLALENVRVRQLTDQIREQRGGQLRDDVLDAIDPEGVARTRAADEAGRKLRAAELKLDRLRARRRELDEGQLSAAQAAELSKVNDQIDSELNSVAEAVADGAEPSVLGLSADDVIDQADVLAARAQVDPSVADVAAQAAKRAGVASTVRGQGLLPNVGQPTGEWFPSLSSGSVIDGLGVRLAAQAPSTGRRPGGATLNLRASVENPLFFEGDAAALEAAIDEVGVDAYRASVNGQGFDSVVFRTDDGGFDAVAMSADQIGTRGDETLATDWFAATHEHMKGLNDLQVRSAAALDTEISKLSSDVLAHRRTADNLAQVAEANRVSTESATGTTERVLRQAARRAFDDAESLTEPALREMAEFSGIAEKLAADVERDLASGKLTLPSPDSAVKSLQRADIAESLSLIHI